MIPRRTSTIFKNRWWAVLLAAGVQWFAYDVAGGALGDSGDDVIAVDAKGAPVTTDDAQRLTGAINSI